METQPKELMLDGVPVTNEMTGYIMVDNDESYLFENGLDRYQSIVHLLYLNPLSVFRGQQSFNIGKGEYSYRIVDGKGKLPHFYKVVTNENFLHNFYTPNGGRRIVAWKMKSIREISLKQLIREQVNYLIKISRKRKDARSKSLLENGIAWFSSAEDDLVKGIGRERYVDMFDIRLTGDRTNVATNVYGTQYSNSGNGGIFASTALSLTAASAGSDSIIAATGDYAVITASGATSLVIATGKSAHIACTHGRSTVLSTGAESEIIATDEWAQIISTGNNSTITSTANAAAITSTGNNAKIIVQGSTIYNECWYCHITGKNSVLTIFGEGHYFKASAGTKINYIWQYEDYIETASYEVGTDDLKADTLYCSSDNCSFEECDDEFGENHIKWTIPRAEVYARSPDRNRF